MRTPTTSRSGNMARTCSSASSSFGSSYCGTMTPPFTMRKFMYEAMATSSTVRGSVPSTTSMAATSSALMYVGTCGIVSLCTFSWRPFASVAFDSVS